MQRLLGDPELYTIEYRRTDTSMAEEWELAFGPGYEYFRHPMCSRFPVGFLIESLKGAQDHALEITMDYPWMETRVVPIALVAVGDPVGPTIDAWRVIDDVTLCASIEVGERVQNAEESGDGD